MIQKKEQIDMLICGEYFDSQTALKQACELHREGNLADAAHLYAKIIAREPMNADVLHLMGVMSGQCGDVGQAAKLIRQAIDISPDAAMYYVSLGDLFRSESDKAKRIASYRRALDIDPRLVEAWCNLGNAYREADCHQDAIDCYLKAIKLAPEGPELYNNLGLAYLAARDLPQATAAFEQAIKLTADHTEALTNLANIFRNQGRFAEADQLYDRALAGAPDDPILVFSRGVFFHYQEQFDKAKGYYEKVKRLRPDHYGVTINLGKLYHDQNDFDNALKYYDKAQVIDPSRADALFYRSLVLLTMGHFEEGWRQYESRFGLKRWRRIYPHKLKIPRWNGERLTGKRVLVISEQGFGDAIQFARFLPLLKAQGCDITFEVQPELMELFSGLTGVDRLMPISDRPPRHEGVDFFVPLLSLPSAFKTTWDSIPTHIPYLQVAPSKRRFWQSRIDTNQFNVGIVWQAKPTYRHNKSVSLAQFKPLFDVPGICIYGLQKYETGSNCETLPKGLENWGGDFKCFADTAAAIDCLDLIVSVDTAVAHLAGAMAKQTWVLLPFSADWRWFTAREDSPWYPTMRLYRQKRIGDWSSVFKSVADDLYAIRRQGSKNDVNPFV